jgi:transcriptional pleiotropic regulator of transition state genes
LKATGIIRRIDDLGRVVIPKELRKVYEWGEGDPLEIFTTDQGVVLRKYVPRDACKICEGPSLEYVVVGSSTRICLSCAKTIARAAQGIGNTK